MVDFPRAVCYSEKKPCFRPGLGTQGGFSMKKAPKRGTAAQDSAFRRGAARLTDVFAALMLTLFILWPGTDGYAEITRHKYRMMWVLGGGYLALLALYAVELAVMRQLARLKAPRLREVPAEKLLFGGFLAFSTLSALFSPWRGTALLGGERREGLVTLALYCGVFFAVGCFGRARVWMAHVLGGTMCLFCALSLWQLAGGNPLGLYPAGLTYFDAGKAYSGAYLGTIGNVDLVAVLLCLAVPVFVYTIALTRGKGRFWLILPLGASLALAWRMNVLACWVGLGLGLLLTIPMNAKTRKARALLALGVGAALLAGAAAVCFLPNLPGAAGELHSLMHGEAEDSFGTGRVFIWRNVLALVPERPLLGGGPDTLGLRVTQTFQRYDAAQNALFETSIDAAHSDPLNILVNDGALALLCQLGALGVLAARSFQSRTAAVRILAAAILCAYIDLLFGISMPQITPLFYLALGLLEGTLQAEKRAKKDKK